MQDRNPEYSYIVLLCLLSSVLSTFVPSGPVVNTTYGPVCGEIVDSSNTIRSYYAFKGIPYAAPPVGQRRFKEPQEPEPWQSIRNATEYGAKCIHFSVLANGVVGEENCLFINVLTAFAPETWHDKKRPVLVWFHSGILESGNFDVFQPDYALDKFVIVSFNMRLGVMGYLNSEDSDAPGNVGIKDALLAMNWVKNNIGAFGGDSDNVLAVGDEFGSAVITYLMLTPQSKGLFHKVETRGGSPLSPWFYSSNPRESTVRLWEYWKPSCHDYQDLLSCLQSVNAKTLVENEQKATPEDVRARYGWTPFLPSKEAQGSSSRIIFTEEPYELLRSGKFQDVPFITGYSNADSIFFMSVTGLTTIPSRWKDLEVKLVDICKEIMPQRLRTKEAVLKMRSFYIGDLSLSNGFYDLEIQEKFVQMTTDLITSWFAVSTALLMSEAGAKVYLYENAYEAHNPYFKDHVYNASHLHGVAHGDNLCILFKNTLENNGERYCDSESDRTARKNAIELLYNYALTGNPTPKSSSYSPTWETFTPTDQGYFYMGESNIFRDHVLGERKDFWTNLIRSGDDDINDDDDDHDDYNHEDDVDDDDDDDDNDEDDDDDDDDDDEEDDDDEDDDGHDDDGHDDDGHNGYGYSY